MEYRSVADLNGLVLAWTRSLPADLDLVVGIPRSGMLVAGLLALHLHLPVTDVRGLCEGRLMQSGRRHKDAPDLGRQCKVLVVDDSICSGGSMAEVQSAIQTAGLPHEIHYGAVIASPEAVRDGKIRLFAEVVPMPRLFEWNIMHAPSISSVCMAFEGVLSGGDGNEAPLVRPRYEIGWIVSSRPESRRAEAEAWLEAHGIEYQTLLMDCTDLAETYRGLEADVLVVRSAAEASGIAAGAGRPVFSTEAGSMVYPGDYPRYLHLPMRPPHPLDRAARFLAYLPIRVVNKLARWTIGRAVIPVMHEDTSHLRHAVPQNRLDCAGPRWGRRRMKP